MSDSEITPAGPRLDAHVVYRPYAFDPPANPMGNKLGANFGNPAFDGRVLQIDGTYPQFIENYNAVQVSGHFESYAAENRLSPSTRNEVCGFVRDTMLREYPEYFRVDATDSGITLRNTLLDESIRFDPNGDYVGGGRFAYNNNLDALAAQIPEDLAIVQLEKGEDRLAAVHVIAPSGWAPREKLGGSFVEVHHPVEHHRDWFAKVQAGVRNLAKSDRPVQRFGWSLTNDADLNHHPQYGGTSGESRVRGDRDLYVRVERQVLKGFPEHSALLFTIRVYAEPCTDLPSNDRAKLREAVRAMSPAERAYKGVLGDYDRIIEQLSD